MKSSERQSWAPVLPGFEHVTRTVDIDSEKLSAKVMPGYFYVTLEDEAISTVLGSCVAACVRDPVRGIGGMNHFMLPGHGASASVNDNHALPTKYGPNAMDALIQTILRWGGKRENLELKLFGGGAVLDFELNKIGDQNIECARRYARANGLQICAEDMGGPWPRKVIFEPLTGRVMVKRMRKLQSRQIGSMERGLIRRS